MKILVIDRDTLTGQMIRSRLEPLGHEIFEETVKNEAADRLMRESFDIIFLDPSPLTSPRPLILNIRRHTKNYPYIFLLSETLTQEDAVKSGSNDLVSKPIDPKILNEKVANAERLVTLVRRIGDDSEDFPSAGGVIAKSAINQLFLAAIDRADRYGERSFMLQIALKNYKEIRDLDGPYAAEYAVAKLCQHLVLLRRQSDIIGQTAKNEYTLLLQRPIYETEPFEAANRFTESISKFKDITSSGTTKIEISICLLDVPAGEMLVEHTVNPES
ncbi:MAG: response regulator [Alphaproteobacteria bacterium]|nr:response regulator [Alphaproteobacteria bacterium]